MSYLLSVDAGTTASKVGLFNVKGELLASSAREYDLITPSPAQVEIAADTIWEAFVSCVHEILRRGFCPDEIKAIGIAAQGETLIPVDKGAQPLRNAIVWLDNRAQEEAIEIGKEFDSLTFYKTSGQVKPVPTWPASKILWLKKHEPSTFENASKYILVEDYLIHKMTKRFVSEGSLLCSTTYWNIRTRKWWNEMLDFIGITPDQLPEVWESAEPIDTLTGEAAEDLGLAKSTLVCTGALDQAAGAVGVGAIQPGLFSENTGAALAICAPLDELRMDSKRQMPIHYFAKPATYMVHTFTTGGMVLRWFRDRFCQRGGISTVAPTNVDSYDIIDAEAAKVPPCSEGLVMLPHLQGAMAPESNPSAKGVFYGFTLRHTKAHFARAIMEAIACVIRRNIEALHDMRIEIAEIRALGGGAKSSLWKQIEADMTGKSVVTTIAQSEACLGAAILAGKAAGVFNSIDEACARMVRINERFIPNSKNFDTYSGLYRKYTRLYDDLLNLFSEEKT
jgi:sugar (pentulose or hexulose) kinase